MFSLNQKNKQKKTTSVQYNFVRFFTKGINLIRLTEIEIIRYVNRFKP